LLKILLIHFMRKYIILGLIPILWNINSKAQTPTWSETIAPILYANCTKCHHPGGLGGSSFIDYQNVVDRKYGISYQVENKTMPPWPGDPTYRHYADERILKQSEIDAIVSWVKNGTPEGDVSKAPKKPVYNNLSKIGVPDIQVQIPTYTSTASSSDVYQCFSIPTNLTANKFLSAIELIPGNPGIVHHVLVFQDTTNTTDVLDAASPGPGYLNFGGTGSNTSILLAPYVPGADPLTFPKGTGIKLYKNARIILQIHYPAGSQNQKDSTKVLLKFSDETAPREVFIAPVLNQDNMSNGPLIIPKDQVKTFYQSYTIPINITLLSVMPHMHLIGKSTKVFIKPPTGDTIPLVKIKNWDFHWQGQYKFQYLQMVTPGSKIQSIVTYDNTINNPNQPSNPPKTVTLGEATTSEMILTYFYFMFYQTGDEKILQDSSLINTGIYNIKADRMAIFPNPVKDQIRTGIMEQNASVKILNMQGQVVLDELIIVKPRLTKEMRYIYFDVSSLLSGIYTVIITTESNGKVYYSKFIKI
jgi:mono/diheme cytochrome c family protein